MQRQWSEQLIIRPLAENDLAPVAQLEAQEPSAWSPAAIAAELNQPGGVQLAAVSGDTVIAWCCGRCIGLEGELLKLVVTTSRRRAGIASRLLASLEHLMQLAGVSSLFLEVRAGNHGAVTFYRHHGFTEIGRRIRYYSGPLDDALVLKKNLSESDQMRLKKEKL